MQSKQIEEQIEKHFKSGVIPAVVAEMAFQDFRWGADRQLHNNVWDTILGEEVGEVSEAAILFVNAKLGQIKGNVSKHTLEVNTKELRSELVQVAAVAMQWIEALDRSK
ncbi:MULTISPECIES: hypothetical protein [unclassified Vibrio]|nr:MULTISPECIES: hypothetical protein [unclassified Vibrio]OXX58245.1 hypothetical protein B9J82_08790 [Vibrio sp. V10_P2A27P122]